MPQQNTPPNLPIVLRIPAEARVLPLMLSVFFGLVILCLGAVMGVWAVCAAGAGVVPLGILWFCAEGKKEIIFQADQVTVRTVFSQETYPYEGMSFLFRRSWTVTGRRWMTSGSGMLADTAIQFRQGNRAVLSIPASWRGAKGFQEAVALLENLPNPKKYL